LLRAFSFPSLKRNQAAKESRQTCPAAASNSGSSATLPSPSHLKMEETRHARSQSKRSLATVAERLRKMSLAPLEEELLQSVSKQEDSYGQPRKASKENESVFEVNLPVLR